MKSIGVISLGCSKNRINTEQMMYLLSNAGYTVSGETDGADIVLLNTCGFIEGAKEEAIETILKLAAAKNEGKIGKLIVAGCLPQRYKDDILSELPEIDAVVGTGSFDDIAEVVDEVSGRQGRQGRQGGGQGRQESGQGRQGRQRSGQESGQESGQGRQKNGAFFKDISAPVSEIPRLISTSPVWAYLKIAEGCDNRCAYCVIPDIRGSFRSRPLENIVEEAEKLVEAGIRELIIVAQDVTGYGYDIYGEYRLPHLLRELNKIKKLKWIRLHYMYPEKISDEIIDVIAKSDKILKYLDIPIQHINDEILKKMNRRGSGADIRSLFERLRERIPGVVLRTSLIVGLPGEGDREFGELCKFLQEMKIEKVGVFAYSPEEGTAAALMERPSKEIAERRAEQINELQSEIMYEWNRSRIGTITTVLKEPSSGLLEPSQAHCIARSYAESPEIDGYIHLRCKKAESLYPTFIECRIVGVEDGILLGEPI